MFKIQHAVFSMLVRSDVHQYFINLNFFLPEKFNKIHCIVSLL